MRLPRFDVVLGLTASAVDVLIEPARVASGQIGDDKACIASVRAGLDAGDEAVLTSPALRTGEELFEVSNLAVFRRSLEHRRRFGLEGQDMRSQRRGRRHAEDEVETVGAADVDGLRRAIMAVATQQDFGLGPRAASGAQPSAQQGPDLLAAGPSGGAQNGGDEAGGAIEHDDRLK